MKKKLKRMGIRKTRGGYVLTVGGMIYPRRKFRTKVAVRNYWKRAMN